MGQVATLPDPYLSARRCLQLGRFHRLQLRLERALRRQYGLDRVRARETLRPLVETIPVFFILYAPAITMRLVSEEKRAGTIELLSTWPVTDTEIVLGKFFGEKDF